MSCNELNTCPNCGSEFVKLNKRRGKFQYECDGDCWTATRWHSSEIEARREWNNLTSRKGYEVKLELEGGADIVLQ